DYYCTLYLGSAIYIF
nr:immunoglobulin light chain junction region [Macaca mulatta]